jgi:hypothetical protein
MTKSWQSPTQEVTVHYRGRKTSAWVLWINEHEVELRVISYTPYPLRYTEYLGPDGTWHWIEEAEIIPASKVWPVEPLIEKGIIKPLEDEVHVYAGNIDACLRCGYTGQQRHSDRKQGFEMHCLGWLVGSGIG